MTAPARGAEAASASAATDYREVRVYCDEPADATFLRCLQTASRFLRRIPDANISVYPPYQALGASGAHLVELVREDRPDFVFTYRNEPFLVLEVTEHGYTGDNPLQRFTRFATTAEQRVPFLYFTPFARTRDDELDEAVDPSTLSKRRVNSNVFVGMLRLAEIFGVPMMARDWPVAENGKPIKLGGSPTPERVQRIFGGLIEVLDLFVSDFAARASAKQDITGDGRIRALQDEVRTVAAVTNVRNSAVKLELPGERLIELVCEPRRLLEHIDRRGYFFADKPERLLALRCIEESRVQSVELPSGAIVAANNPRAQLAAVFGSPKFTRAGYLQYTGYKWRSDPHCGVLVNVDYVYCRRNGARTPAEREGALVLFYPRVALRASSNAHAVVEHELEHLLQRGTKLYQLFEERYANDNPGARREKFTEITEPIGLWKETTKQARIFRKYCDLIVLSDAILLGNHWKT